MKTILIVADSASTYDASQVNGAYLVIALAPEPSVIKSQDGSEYEIRIDPRVMIESPEST